MKTRHLARPCGDGPLRRRMRRAASRHAGDPLGRLLRDWPDWMIGSAGLALFVVAVQAILAVMRGWTVPAHVWSAAASFALALMAVHALARIVVAGRRRDAAAARRCAAAAAALVACLVAVVALGGAARAECGCDFGDATAAEGPR